VLVNNAGFGQLGVFEELAPDDIDYQFRVNVFGVFDVTRAVLPVMREQRSGHIFNITSIGGLRGGAGYSMYASTKFALEGFSESLSLELATFGIHVTAVEPGYFRTDFLDASSVKHGQNAIADYAESTAAAREFMEGRNHNQQGDPAKLALTLLELAKADKPPHHFVVGTDAVAVLETRIQRDTEQLATWRELSSSTDFPA
jgi:NAD(P)-dependent dehydrogenase (short-subunit alcohol dehydrogenase family)